MSVFQCCRVFASGFELRALPLPAPAAFTSAEGDQHLGQQPPVTEKAATAPCLPTQLLGTRQRRVNRRRRWTDDRRGEKMASCLLDDSQLFSLPVPEVVAAKGSISKPTISRRKKEPSPPYITDPMINAFAEVSHLTDADPRG